MMTDAQRIGYLHGVAATFTAAARLASRGDWNTVEGLMAAAAAGIEDRRGEWFGEREFCRRAKRLARETVER